MFLVAPDLVLTWSGRPVGQALAPGGRPAPPNPVEPNQQ